MKSLEWLAGLLEGEGCFTQNGGSAKAPLRYPNPTVALVMTDADVVKEANLLCEVIGERVVKIHESPLPTGKVAYSITLTGLAAVKIMVAVLPHMGIRRTVRIRQVLREWVPKKYREAVTYRQTLEGVL